MSGMDVTVNGEPVPVTSGDLPPDYSSLWKRYNDLRQAAAELADEMYASARMIAPGGEPDNMPDIADQARAEALHEYAGRILALLEDE